MSSATPALVDTAWLAAHLDDADLIVADASWYLPQAKRDPHAEYAAAHIPGAVFFDIEALSDPATGLPHMLQQPALFARGLEQAGIGSDSFVVFYDGAGIYSAPRARWMLQVMGHERVSVLDGGLPKWRSESRPLTDAPTQRRQARFTPLFRPELIRDFKAIEANLASKDEQMLDARSGPRFRGEEQEPRPGVRPGHIPGSTNIHYAQVVTPAGTLRSADELRRLFAARGVDLARPAVTSCGSGITAAILSLALDVAGAKRHALYDGSWAEWGANGEAPIATGAA